MTIFGKMFKTPFDIFFDNKKIIIREITIDLTS